MNARQAADHITALGYDVSNITADLDIDIPLLSITYEYCILSDARDNVDAGIAVHL